MKLEEITSHIDHEEGWNDIFLSIVDIRESPNSIIFTAKGLYKSEIVGLQVEVQKGMVAGLLSSGEINQNAFYRDGIRFLSIGDESNKLIKALSELYHFPTDKGFPESIDGVMIFSLNEINVDLTSNEKYKFKLFFHDNSDDLYCEMYCNIDLTNAIIELHEKDEEYREKIIKVFSK